MSSKIEALEEAYVHFFVVVEGYTNKDGVDIGFVFPFDTKQKAESIIRLQKSGIKYVLLTTIEEMKKYCDKYGLDYRNYLSSRGLVII